MHLIPDCLGKTEKNFFSHHRGRQNFNSEENNNICCCHCLIWVQTFFILFECLFVCRLAKEARWGWCGSGNSGWRLSGCGGLHPLLPPTQKPKDSTTTCYPTTTGSSDPWETTRTDSPSRWAWGSRSSSMWSVTSFTMATFWSSYRSHIFNIIITSFQTNLELYLFMSLQKTKKNNNIFIHFLPLMFVGYVELCD